METADAATNGATTRIQPVAHGKESQPAMTQGLYNQQAKTQEKAMGRAVQLLVHAAACMPLTPGRPVQVLELGCSQGVNSMQPVKAILEGLTARAAAEKLAGRLQVAVSHNDLPGNDFQPLLSLIEDTEKTYVPQNLASPLAVYPSVIGRSFYKRLLPDNSVQLVFSATTLHWISASAPSDALLGYMSEDVAVRKAYEEQALRDLTQVLRLRAEEVVDGGMLQAHFPITGGTPKSSWALQPLNQVVVGQLAVGHLTKEEVSAMASPSYLRTEREVEAALEAVKDVWEVESFSIEHVTSPPAAQLAEGSITPALYASATRKQRAAVFQGYMQSQLAIHRGKEEAERATCQLFDEYERALAAAPPPEEGLTTVYMLLRRRAR